MLQGGLIFPLFLLARVSFLSYFSPLTNEFSSCCCATVLNQTKTCFLAIISFQSTTTTTTEPQRKEGKRLGGCLRQTSSAALKILATAPARTPKTPLVCWKGPQHRLRWLEAVTVAAKELEAAEGKEECSRRLI